MSTQPEKYDEVLCPCTGTTRGLIHELFLQGKDLDGISRYTGIFTGCGGCEWDIGQYLKELAENNQPDSQ